jgi:thioredoxin 2
MAPAFEQAARELEPGVRLAKVDTEAEPGLGARYGVRSIPTMIVFRGGREAGRRTGAMGAADIVRWIRGLPG